MKRSLMLGLLPLALWVGCSQDTTAESDDSGSPSAGRKSSSGGSKNGAGSGSSAGTSAAGASAGGPSAFGGSAGSGEGGGSAGRAGDGGQAGEGQAGIGSQVTTGGSGGSINIGDAGHAGSTIGTAGSSTSGGASGSGPSAGGTAGSGPSAGGAGGALSFCDTVGLLRETGGPLAYTVQQPPTGADKPPAPSAPNQCPALSFGAGSPNSITSAGMPRQFYVLKPSTPCPGETYPVVFFWHSIGTNGAAVASDPKLQLAVDSLRAVVVVPVAAGATVFGQDTKWPFDTTQPEDRMQQEYAFFDDMLSCVEGSASITVNPNFVGSVGVSAGALFQAQLMQARSVFFSSSMVLAGGTGGLVKGWSGAARNIPTMVAWGGGGDAFPGFSFDQLSQDLESHLVADGHFLVECKHNCGHSMPKIEGSSAYEMFIRFFLDHPYWLTPGTTTYSGALPSYYPSWCGIGQNSAQPANLACE